MHILDIPELVGGGCFFWFYNRLQSIQKQSIAKTKLCAKLLHWLLAISALNILFTNTAHMNWNPKFKSSIVADKLLTCLRINGEVGLPLKNAVDHSSTVSIGGIISICSLDLKHICT